jgi:hypothetical protein
MDQSSTSPMTDAEIAELEELLRNSGSSVTRATARRLLADLRRTQEALVEALEGWADRRPDEEAARRAALWELTGPLR